MILLLAIDAAQLLKDGEAIGTSSNQVILGVLVVLALIVSTALVGVVIYLHRLTMKTQSELHAENKVDIKDLVIRMDARENAMTEERKARIATLMQQQKEDIEVKHDVKHAIDNNTKAIGANTEAVKELRELMHKMLEMMTRQK